MTAFAAAMAALHRDPNLSVQVLWGPGGDAPDRPLRAVTRAPDDLASFGQTRAVVATLRLDVIAADVPGMARGDRLTVAGRGYTIASAPQRDRDGILLTIEAHPDEG